MKQEEQITIIIYLLNYLAQEINKGKKELNEEAFSLYDFAIKGNVLIYEGYLETNQFRNMINVACHLKKYDWAKYVIANQSKFLKNEIQSQQKKSAMVMVQFEEKKFEEVVNIISSMKFEDPAIELTSRVYMLASRFELDETEDLNNDCDTFIRYIRRNKKLGEGQKLGSITFAQIIKHLINQKLPKSSLEHFLNQDQNLYLRTWLTNKVQNYSQIKTAY